MWLGEMREKEQIIQDEQAISVVIGVVLMVAVAIAMAAVGYAYMTGLIGGQNLEEAPIIDFTADYNENTLLLTYKDTDFNWEDIYIVASQGSPTETIQDETGPLTGAASVGEKIYLNDEITAFTGTVIVTITHRPSDTMMGDFTFEEVT